MAFREPNQDLFESSRMSFGAHLEELRKVLIRCAIAVGICSVLGFYFANDVVQYLTTPLQDAMADYQTTLDLKRLAADEGFVDPELLPWMEEKRLSPQTFYMDPGVVVEMLRSVSPDFLAGIDLDPYGFLPSHLDPKQAAELCRNWTADREVDSPRGKRLKYMWEALTDPQRNAITAISEKESGGTLSSSELSSIVEAFNHIAGREDLHEQPGFSELASPPKATLWNWLAPARPNPLTSIAEKLNEGPNPELNMRLNRVLISSQFGTYMPPARTNLVPVPMWSRIDVQPQSLTAMEPFMIWLKAGLITGLVIASPVVFYLLWSFVAAGLYPHEQKYVYIFLPISLLLFFCGASLAFFFAFKPVLGFLFAFNAQMGITPQLRINEWMNFVLFLPVGFGIAFQLPLVMLFLNRINVFSVSNYLSKWRIAIMVIFVMSMILTPSDPISMILLAIPLTALYFLGVALCYYLPRNENPFADAEATQAEA